MAGPDFTIKRGDTLPVLSDTLVYSDGSAVNLTGASVNFVMRPMTALAPTTNAVATVVSPTAGTVSYTFTTGDTAASGVFSACWRVTFSGGTLMTFPTVGQMEVSIEEDIITPGGQRIVGLGEALDYLGIQTTDRTRDAKILRFIDGATPVIEDITGPIIQRVYTNEKHDATGSTWWIVLRHRPVVSVSSVTEYRGPIPYPLTQIVTPDLGTIYSYMVDTPDGRLTRRTVGGGTTSFPPGTDTVWVTYTAGYTSPPLNVVEATLELLRDNFQPTQQGRPPAGNPDATLDADIDKLGANGYFVSPRVRALLSPNKRHPRFA